MPAPPMTRRERWEEQDGREDSGGGKGQEGKGAQGVRAWVVERTKRTSAQSMFTRAESLSSMSRTRVYGMHEVTIVVCNKFRCMVIAHGGDKLNCTHCGRGLGGWNILKSDSGPPHVPSFCTEVLGFSPSLVPSKYSMVSAECKE